MHELLGTPRDFVVIWTNAARCAPRLRHRASGGGM